MPALTKLPIAPPTGTRCPGCLERVALAPLVALALLLGAADATAQRAPPPLYVYDFTLDASPAENIDHVRALGYSGLVTRLKWAGDLDTLEQYARKADSLDDFQLLAYIAYEFNNPASPTLWRDALPILAHFDAPLWVVVKQAPSHDAIVDLLAEMARTAEAFGVPAVIYPHFNTDISTAAEAADLIAEVGHPNLRNSIHTCHEIRGGNQDDMPAVVDAHVADTALVALAGADSDAYAGPPNPFLSWDDCIKPLDQGDWSLLPFLQALHDSGYDGPVILQTFGIVNDPGHLLRSRRTYTELTQQLVTGGTKARGG